MEKVFWITVLGLIALGILTLVYHIVVASYHGIRVILSCPFKKGYDAVIWSDGFFSEAGYFLVGGYWYKSYAKKDWEEAKFSEPVNTLLTLIYKDHHNFTYGVTKTDAGYNRYITLEHNSLDISGSFDNYETGNSLRMFGKDIHISQLECKVITLFFVQIAHNKAEYVKQQKIEILQKERLDHKQSVVDNIQEYLKENL